MIIINNKWCFIRNLNPAGLDLEKSAKDLKAN